MKLQLGTSRFDRLTPAALSYFLTPGWIHLGDAAPQGRLKDRIFTSFREYGAVNFLRIIRDVLARRLRARYKDVTTSRSIDASEFKVIPFFYQKGDRLSYPDCEFAFIYSEHFFEHLFLDEAVALLRECFRVLAPGGVVRICVPDADLRVNLPPEPAGFPYRKMPFTHPEKHKTRWSVYSLGEALRLCGFRPVPLRYHDRHGVLHDFSPESLRAQYPERRDDAEFILTLAYVQRARSLIVDGIKS